MGFCDFLKPRAVRIGDAPGNRKKSLEVLAELLCEDKAGRREVFERLLEREKLGSTALGNRVAVPHCRLDELQRPTAALLRTREGVPFDAPDGLPVSLFCALVVPQNAEESHLQLLADLAERLRQPERLRRLLRAEDAGEAVRLLAAEPAAQQAAQ